jgi:hypothetical protein
LHALRLFVSSEALRSFLRAEEDGSGRRVLQDEYDRSLSNQYDGLVSIWAMHLANLEKFDLLFSLVIELVENKKESCLNGLFTHLAGHNSGALTFITRRLIESGRNSLAVSLVLHVARLGKFETTRTLTLQFVTLCKNYKVIYTLIGECALISPAIADVIVRQLALGQGSAALRTLAVEFAKQNDHVILYMILDQLLASEADFSALVLQLTDSIKPHQIDSFARWLLKAGLTCVIEEKVKSLSKRKHEKLAMHWSRFLVPPPAES